MHLSLFKSKYLIKKNIIHNQYFRSSIFISFETLTVSNTLKMHNQGSGCCHVSRPHSVLLLSHPILGRLNDKNVRLSNTLFPGTFQPQLQQIRHFPIRFKSRSFLPPTFQSSKKQFEIQGNLNYNSGHRNGNSSRNDLVFSNNFSILGNIFSNLKTLFLPKKKKNSDTFSLNSVTESTENVILDSEESTVSKSTKASKPSKSSRTSKTKSEVDSKSKQVISRSEDSSPETPPMHNIPENVIETHNVSAEIMHPDTISPKTITKTKTSTALQNENTVTSKKRRKNSTRDEITEQVDSEHISCKTNDIKRINTEKNDAGMDGAEPSDSILSEKTKKSNLERFVSEEPEILSDRILSKSKSDADIHFDFLQFEEIKDLKPSKTINSELKNKCIKGLMYEANYKFCNMEGAITSFQNFLVSWLNQTEDALCLILSKYAKSYALMTTEKRKELLNLIAEKVLGFSSLDDLIAQEEAMQGLEKNKQSQTQFQIQESQTKSKSNPSSYNPKIIYKLKSEVGKSKLADLWTDSWHSNMKISSIKSMSNEQSQSQSQNMNRNVNVNYFVKTSRSKTFEFDIKSKKWLMKSEEQDFLFLENDRQRMPKKAIFLNRGMEEKYENFLNLEKILSEKEREDWKKLSPYAKIGIEFGMSEKIDIWKGVKKKKKKKIALPLMSSSSSSYLEMDASTSSPIPLISSPLPKQPYVSNISSIEFSIASSSTSSSSLLLKRKRRNKSSPSEGLLCSSSSSSSFSIPSINDSFSLFSIKRGDAYLNSNSNSLLSGNSLKFMNPGHSIFGNEENTSISAVKVSNKRAITPHIPALKDEEGKSNADMSFSNSNVFHSASSENLTQVISETSRKLPALTSLKKKNLEKRKKEIESLKEDDDKTLFMRATDDLNGASFSYDVNGDHTVHMNDMVESNTMNNVDDVDIELQTIIPSIYSNDGINNELKGINDDKKNNDADQISLIKSSSKKEKVKKQRKNDENNENNENDDGIMTFLNHDINNHMNDGIVSSLDEMLNDDNDKYDDDKNNNDNNVIKESEKGESKKKESKKNKKNGDLTEFLDKKISDLKFLTPTQREKLNMEKFYSVRQLIQHFPRTYIDYTNSFDEIKDGSFLAVIGTVSDVRTSISSFNLSCLLLKMKCRMNKERKITPIERMYGLENDKMKENDKTELNEFEIHWKKYMRGKFGPVSICRFLEKLFAVGDAVLITGKVKEIGTGKFDMGSVGEVKNLKKMKEENLFEVKMNENENENDNKDDNNDFNKNDNDNDSVNNNVNEYTDILNHPIPIYPSKGLLKPSDFQNMFSRLLPKLPSEIDSLPTDIKIKFELMDLKDAVIGIHKPENNEIAKAARQRLVFDEFFYHQLGMLFMRNEMRMNYIAKAIEIYSNDTNDRQESNIGNPYDDTKENDVILMMDDSSKGEYPIDKWHPLAVSLLKSLPFQLTASQYFVLSEIMHDLSIPVPMNRLLQGDVGCGKTIIALIALTAIVGCGYQAAIMAPTEFLAQQHASKIVKFYEFLPEDQRPKVCLLTGSTKRAKSVRLGLQTGDIQIAIGTHALISDGTSFQRLGLAVIDEQHKFGVAQRSRILEKGIGIDSDDEMIFKSKTENGPVCLSVPHVLAMSATPIPRTLALAMYGNMSISKISELPPGRSPIKTIVLSEESRADAYDILRQEIENGGRAFIVFPLIEKSDVMSLRCAEEEYDELTRKGGYLHTYSCGLIHGRIPAQEKNEVMKKFKNGELKVIISTTVIEVGIDVPEASVMLVEHSERYGLAQLHQLRGRVGRGERKSICIFLSSTIASQAKLKALEKITDGFVLAELDLQRRGPGEFFGKKQSGNLPEFVLARLEEDGDVMENARIAAEELMEKNQLLEDHPRLRSELVMRKNSLSFCQ